MLKLSLLLICCTFFENLQAANYGFNMTTKLCDLVRVPSDGKKYSAFMYLYLPKADNWVEKPQVTDVDLVPVAKVELGKSVIASLKGELYDRLIVAGPRVYLAVTDETGAPVANVLSQEPTGFGNQYGESPPLTYPIPCNTEPPCPFNFAARFRYNFEIHPSFAQEAHRPYAVVSFNSIKTTWAPADTNNPLPAVSTIVHAVTQNCDPETVWNGYAYNMNRHCDYEIAFTLQCGNENVAQWTVTLPDDQENFEGRDDQSPKIMFTRAQFVNCFMEDRGLGQPNGRLSIEVKDRDVRDIKDTLATHDFWLWAPGKPVNNSYSPSYNCGAKFKINGVAAGTLEAPIDLNCGIEMGLSVKLFNFPKVLTTRYVGPHKEFAAEITIKEKITTQLCLPPQSNNDECKCKMLCLGQNEERQCNDNCKQATFAHYNIFKYEC